MSSRAGAYNNAAADHSPAVTVSPLREVVVVDDRH